MMRGTYFRAWDIEAKCYVQEPILVDNFGQVYVVCEEASKEEGTCLITGKPNVIIEQDTGLKDKNGEKICEGDIVEYTTHYYGNEKRHRKVVEWEEWDSDDFGEPHNLGYFNLSEYMTVIGNIHENPELLEQDNAKD